MKTFLNNILKVLTSEERRKLIKLAFSDLIISILDIFFLAVLLYVVNFYAKAGEHNINLLPPVFKQYPLLLISCFFVFFSCKNYVASLVFKSHYTFVYTVASRISKNKLIQYLQGNYHDYTDIDSSVHIHRISQQPVEFCHYVLKGILQISSQALLLLITLTAVLLYDAPVFLLLFILLTPPVFIVSYILKKRLHSSRRYAKSASEKSLQHLQEALSGYVESKIYNKEAFFTERYHEQQHRLNRYLADQQVIQNIPSRLIEVFAIFGLFILMVINQLYAHAPALQIITIGAFIAACYKIIPGIVKIMNSIGQVKTYAYTAKDLEPRESNNSEPSKEVSNIHSVELSKVSFGYKKVRVLNNFSMKLKEGDFLGMSGTSGKGKTTLLNILLGFISPINGTIAVNDINKMQAHLCWKKIAYVKQQPFLINDTVRTNITLNEGLQNDRKLFEVMQVTGVDHIVQMYQNGLDTIITEHGKNLSGGQRQRIAMARALYKDFDLLILDEPFSELDEEAEMLMMNYLKQISVLGKMVILITHNTKALAFCNKTLSMNEYN